MKLYNTIKRKIAETPLRLKIWLYFVVFSAIVFLLLWFGLIFFLERFYETMKINDVRIAADTIVSSYEQQSGDSFGKTLTDIAVDNDLCVEVLDKYGRSLYSREVLGDCMIHGKENRVYVFLDKITESGNGQIL